MTQTLYPRRHRPRPRVTLDQLHTFIAVAEREHMTGAAAALHMSQGSVSALVGRLEETLRVPLFHRVGRNVRLTDVGQRLRFLATQVLDGVKNIEELRDGYLEFEHGELIVASGRVLGAHRLSEWLAPFISAHPHLRVQIKLAPLQTLVDMLSRGDVDVIVAGDAVDVPGIETIAMERTQMVIVVAAGHPLARSRSPLRELAKYRYLEHERGTATELRAAQVLGGLAERSDAVELEEGALLAALRAGLGFAVMPRAVVERDLEIGGLVALARPGRPVVQVFTAARRQAPHTPAVDALWEHLRRIAIPG
ncbi:MAG TPA: LysR family transcriptional regulator [Candidatus Dormibacteraeota bacterium]